MATARNGTLKGDLLPIGSRGVEAYGELANQAPINVDTRTKGSGIFPAEASLVTETAGAQDDCQ